MPADPASPPVLPTDIAALFEPWREGLSDEIFQAEMARWINAAKAHQTADVLDQARANPVKQTLTEFCRLWLFALHHAWRCDDKTVNKASKELDQVVSALPAEMSDADFSHALLSHRVAGFGQMLWEHPGTKTLVRSIARDRRTFQQADWLGTVQAMDVQAVHARLEQAQSAAGEPAQREAIRATLHKLGHFTSKPRHTSARVIGIVLAPDRQPVGPYLTAGRVMAHGHHVLLDQSVNDSSGKTSVMLGVLNGENEETDPATAQRVRETAAELFAQGHEFGTEAIDPRLPQILLPLPDGRYRAITPLTSMGLSAYLHGQVVAGNTFAHEMSYGFSTTAINNLTAIRRVPHALIADRTVGQIPNRAFGFDVPRLNEAHRMLARVRHGRFRLRLSSDLQGRLFHAYVKSFQRFLNDDSVEAIRMERRIHQRHRVGPYVCEQVLAARAQCAEALVDMGESEREALLADPSHLSALDRYLLHGLENESEQAPSLRTLGEYLAERVFDCMEKLENEGAKLGLSLIDRQRFRRWAPQALAEQFARF